MRALSRSSEDGEHVAERLLGTHDLPKPCITNASQTSGISDLSLPTNRAPIVRTRLGLGIELAQARWSLSSCHRTPLFGKQSMAALQTVSAENLSASRRFAEAFTNRR